MAQQIDIVANLLMKVDGAEAGINKLKNSLSKLKMPEGLENSFKKSFANLDVIFARYRSQVEKGFSTKADVTNFAKTGKALDVELDRISKHFTELTGKQVDFKVNSTEIKNAEQELEKLINQRNELAKSSIKFEITGAKEGYKDIESLLNKLKEVAGNTKTGQYASGALDFLKAGDLQSAVSLLDKASVSCKKFSDEKQKAFTGDTGLSMATAIEKIVGELTGVEGKFGTVNTEVAKFEQILSDLRTGQIKDAGELAQRLADEMLDAGTAAKQANGAMQDFAQSSFNMTQQLNQLQQSTQYFFGLRNMLNLLKRGLKEAVQTVKDLDKAMTETAVVTKFSVSDMWAKLPEYTNNANALGATIQDMYESTTLYYQQGLNTEQAMSIATETMKMARIAGLEAAEATDMMTAALRGFNMEINETSAEHINDVYSNLAAKTASNTEELGTAMQRTASIAASAGMSFEGTAAFLAQAIETTREPAENLGTAMKTIVARFTELKKNPLEISEVDGEEVSYNKVDTALQSIGVSLKDANGQFRDLDKVFLDISQRWDGLTQTQQRYVATMAAGSRQQSRFIAMMSNYDRTVQLMEYANNSAGASQEQFGKTLDSLEAKLNKFQNAWKEFLMGIMNDSWTKGIVDAGTTVLSVVNKLIDALSFGGKAKGIKSVLSLFTAFTALKFAGRGVNALLGGVGGLLDPKSSAKQGLISGFTGRQQATNMAQAKAISTPIVSKLGEILGAIHNIKADTGANKNVKTDSNAVTTTTKQQYAQARQALNNLVGQNATAKSFSIGAASSIFSGLDAEHQLSLFNNSPGTKAAMQKASLDWFNSKGISKELTAEGKTYINSIYKGMSQGTISIDKGIELIGRPDLWGEHFATDTAKAFSKNFELTDTDRKNIADKTWSSLGMKLAAPETRQAWLKENQQKFDAEQDKFIKQHFGDHGGAIAKLSTMGKFANDIGMVGDKFTQAGYGISAFGGLLSQLGGPIGAVGNGLQGLGGIVSSLGMSISGMTSLFTLFTVGITDATGAVVVAGSTIAGIVAPIAALGVAIFAAYKHIQKIKKAGEEVTNTFKEQSKSADDNIATLKSYQGELATLSKGVDSHGNNINLDDSEYQRYLEIVDSIAEINPEIVDGYNAQGHAIINNNKALAETLKTQQELRDEVYKTYTDSLDKLIAARNVNTDYGKAIINSTSSKAEDAGKIKSKKAPFTNDVLSIVDNLSLSTQFDESILKKYNIDSLRALKNGEEDAVNNFVKHREQIEAELRNSGIEISQSVFEGFDQLSENITAFDTAIQPVYDNLLTQVSQSPFYDSVADEFKEALNIGLKDLASQDLSAADMSKAANSMVARFANLTTGSGKYADALKIVETAQNDFATTLDETQYTADVQPAIDELTRLKEEALEEGSAYGDALAEYLDNQIERISRFTEEGAINLSEALNTATDDIAAAESALESFNEATKTDYSTAAEGMKSIFDKTTETFKDSYGTEIQKHAEGMGDATFWTGAEALLSGKELEKLTKGKNGYDAAEAVAKSIQNLEPMLRDGQEGFDAFTDRVLECRDELDKLEGVTYNEDGLLTNIPEDKWHEVAEALGISDDLLTSMLNKGRQFADISFMNLEDARKALATSDFSIKGTQAAPGEQQNLYVKEETLRAELANAGYVRREQQDEQITKLLNQGVKTIPSAEEVTVSDMKDMAGDWGIKTLPDLIQTLNDTGDFTKDEIKAYADKLDLLESDDNFDSLYSDIIEAAENPELVKQTGVLEDISAKVSALIDGRTGNEALDDYNESHKALVGGEGVDTEAQAFAYGKKLNEDGTLGEFLSAGEYEQTKKSLEEVKQSYIESATIAAEKAKISTGKERERWEEVQKGYEEDASRIDKYLGMASNSYEKHLKDMAEAAEAKKIAPGIQRAEDKDKTTTKNEVETTETKTTKEITEKEEHTQVVADAITTGAFEVVNQTLDEINANPNYNANLTTTGDSQGVDTIREGLSAVMAQVQDPLQILTTGDTTGIVTVSNGLSTLPSSKDISITASDNTGSVISRISSKLASLASKALSIGGRGATGINNHISVSRVPTFASAAKGKGQVGPKNKGGLTLTGEKGFEIAWLPSSGESMVLGVGGPQMVNLPSDAVVYTHEQSKDIIKRKGIPAGSHAASESASSYKKKYNTFTTTQTKSSSSKSSSSSSSSSGSGSSSSSSNTTINHFSIEEVIRFNLDKKIEAITSKIKKLTEEIDKNLKRIGTTALDITDSTQEQIKNLKSIKASNDSLVASYQKDLNALDLNKYMMEVSYTDENGDKQDYSFDAQYYLYQSDGQYYINQNYIKKLGSPALQEAVYKAVEGALNPLISGLQKARDAADDAQKQIEDLAEKVADTFYGWENELTEIYDLTQRIENETSFTDRFASQIELDLSRLGVGLGETEKAISNISAVLNRNNQTLKEQIKNTHELINARKRELDNALSTQDELDKIDAYRNSEAYTKASDEERNAVIRKLTDEYDVAANALNYIKNVTRELDGSVTYDIDWEAFEEANRQNPLNEETYKAIKEYLDSLNKATTEYNGSIKDTTDLLKQTYDDLKKYQDTIVDFEGALLKGVEEQIKNDTENAKKLSDSISNALKDLLDEVKRKLDERRRQEDNAKTERDIAQKQQRLAALRANTSGGNQVEIAQLEKEIADAQQSYGRTLEDQLLDKLQQQGDEAKLQRERQIELAEASNEINAANNKELVNLWLKNPELYKEQIKEAWLESQGYDEKGYVEQQTLLNQWDVEWTNLLTAIEQTGFNESTKNIEDNTYTLVELLADATGAVIDATERNTETLKDLTNDLAGAQKAYSKGINAETLKNLGFNAKDLLGANYTAKQLKEGGYGIDDFKEAGITTVSALKDAGFSAQEMKDANVGSVSDFKNAGFTVKDLKGVFEDQDLIDALFDAKELQEAGIDAKLLKDNKFDIQTLKNAGYSLPDLKKAGFTAADFGAGGISYADAKAAGFAVTELKNVVQYAKQAAAELQPKVSQGRDLAYGSQGSDVKLLQQTLNKLGIRDNSGNSLDVDGDFGQHTREAVINFQKKYRNKASKTLSADGVVGYYTKEAFRALGYKTGGLADYTGPAWLDGTPSKPELVLNATDTKNFLALRDVLSSAMKSTSSVANAYGGNATYEININVDKLTSDYDVDRVAERVKKIIVKDSSYRNVTQVRNFR